MPTPQRRKSDPDSTFVDSSHGAADDTPGGAEVWVDTCAARIEESQPELSHIEALQLAEALREFERTGQMEATAAVDFVTAEMRKHSPRFERRAAALAVKSETNFHGSDLA